jgi:hypothetical protein
MMDGSFFPVNSRHPKQRFSVTCQVNRLDDTCLAIRPDIKPFKQVLQVGDMSGTGQDLHSVVKTVPSAVSAVGVGEEWRGRGQGLLEQSEDQACDLAQRLTLVKVDVSDVQ